MTRLSTAPAGACFVVLTAAAVVSCADPTPTAPTIATPRADIVWTGPTNAEFTWVKGQNAVWMGAATNRFCYLSLVGGRFDGPDEWVAVTVNFAGWYLSGSSHYAAGSSAVQARARCVPATGWSNEFSAETDHDNPYKFQNLTGTACAITRVGGRFDGSTDYAEIFPSSGGYTLWVGSSGMGEVNARARCITTPKTDLGKGTWASPNQPTTLNGLSSDFCTLYAVRGPLRTLSDHVWVYRSSTRWALVGAWSPNIKAAANCFR
jgi:hypothetical protein